MSAIIFIYLLALEHVAYEDYHVAEKGLVVLSMMLGTNSEAPRFKALVSKGT